MRFQKGQSGNPGGRPAGARTAVAGLRREMITDGDIAEIVGVVVRKAREGDLTAAGMILDRAIPKLRITADFTPTDHLAKQIKEARERIAQFEADKLLERHGVDGLGRQGTWERLVNISLITGVPDADDEPRAQEVPALSGVSAGHARAREAETEITGTNRPENVLSGPKEFSGAQKRDWIREPEPAPVRMDMSNGDTKQARGSNRNARA